MNKLILFLLLLTASPAWAQTTYYVDATSGSDAANGLTEGTAWQTISRINSGSFSSGDSVLFKCGEIWRNERINKDTAGLTYGAYGDCEMGPKPSIRGSLEFNEDEDWAHLAAEPVALTGITSPAGADDGYYFASGGSFNSSFSDLRFGDEDGVDTRVFLRFALNVPQGATISAATLTLQASGSHSGAITAAIRAVDADDPAAPTTASGGRDQVLTTASEEWSVPNTSAGEHTTPDFASVVQEIVDREGWESGNHIIIVVETTSAGSWTIRDFRSRDHLTAGQRPRLNVTYTAEESSLWYLSDVSADPGVFAHDGDLGQRKTALEGLASAWDYYYDSGDDRLYVFSEGNPAEEADSLEVAVLDRAFDYVWWDGGTVDGLDFRHFREAGFIAFGGGSNWTFTDCTFAQIAGGGIQFNGFESHVGGNAIDGCLFEDWGVVDGQRYAVQAIAAAGDGAGSAQVDIFNSTFIINHSSNLTELGNMSDFNGWIRRFVGNTCINNGLWPGPAACMISWRPPAHADEITIEYNRLVNIGNMGLGVQEYDEYDASPVTRIRYNSIENNGTASVLDQEAIRVWTNTDADVEVAYNIINGTHDGANDHRGIRVSGSSNVKVHGNTIHGADVGILLRHGAEVEIRNNIITGSRVHGVQLIEESSTDGFSNNLFFDNSNDYSGLSAGDGDVTADPLYAGGDLSLLEDSPAIDSGENLGSPYQLGLHPDSMWPDAVELLNQNQNGEGWEIGAFVFPDAAPGVPFITRGVFDGPIFAPTILKGWLGR